MSRKPKRPEIAGLRPDGPWNAKICNYCFDLPHRRPRKPWKNPQTSKMTVGCPGCEKQWEPEPEELQSRGMNAAALDRAAWDLLGDQVAREMAGVSTYEEAVRAVVVAVEIPKLRPEGKRAMYCNHCFGLAHRRQVDKPCAGCGERFAPEMIPIHTGMMSSMAGIPELDSIA